MLIVILTVATLLMTFWLILLGNVSRDDWESAARAKIIDICTAVGKISAKDRIKAEKLASFDGIAHRFMKLLYGNSYRKKAALNRRINRLKNGDMTGLDPLIMPGYVLQRKAEAIGKSNFRKTVLTKCFELYGKKYAGYKAGQLMAKMLSYPIIGIAVTLMIGVISLGTGNNSAGMGIIGIGTCLVLILTYAIYDELSDMVKKRQTAISRQFPNVISKLALLITSGMIVDRAWKETAHSQDTELYLEMRKTQEELDNLVSPEAAYGGFISRCNTKETAKLASAIMQNLSKGNAEIGKLLSDMAREVWQERRHTAKRDAERANAKLMIPTMLLFLAILVMLMVPIAMNFSGI